MTAGRRTAPEEPETRIVDKRRIDPVTGEVRPGVPAATPAATPAPAPPSDPGGPDGGAAERELAERTADLQRLKAEFDNYRRRVDRDRSAVAEQALASVLVGLLPALDDIGRARDHGELEGGFKSVADQLEGTLSRLGLQTYGRPGDPFDPTVHEALTHRYAGDVDGPLCERILQPGYRLGERILRPARVSVVEPAEAEVAEAEVAEAGAAEAAAGSDAPPQTDPPQTDPPPTAEVAEDTS